MTPKPDRGRRRRARPRLHAIGTILLGTLVGQGLVIAVSPLLTRLYTPSDFGALAVVTAIASIIGAGATLGVDRALVVERDASQVRALVALGVGSSLTLGLVLAAITWHARGLLAAAFHTDVLADTWYVIPITTVVIGMYRVGSALLARAQRSGAIARRNAAQGVGQTLWNLGASFSGPLGLVGGLAFGRAVALLGLVRARHVPVLPQAIRGTRSVAGKHRRFLLFSPWSAMLNVIGQQAPALVIASTHGASAAGFVALTMRVLGAPVGMLADAVAQFAAGAIGRQVRDGDPVSELVLRLVTRLLVAGGLAATLVMIIGPASFRAAFGSEWELSGEYARILVPAFAVQVAASPLTQVLSMLGRQALQLTWDIARLVTNTAAVLIPSVLGAPMTLVLGSLAAAMVASYTVVITTVIVVARRADRAGRESDDGPTGAPDSRD